MCIAVTLFWWISCPLFTDCNNVYQQCAIQYVCSYSCSHSPLNCALLNACNSRTVAVLKCLDKINPNFIPAFFFLGCKDLWVLRWLSSLCVSSPVCCGKHHFLFCHKVGQQHSKYCTFLNVTATWSVVDLHLVVFVLQCIFFKASCCHVVWCCCLVLFTCPFPTNNPTGRLWDPFKVFMVCCLQLF